MGFPTQAWILTFALVPFSSAAWAGGEPPAFVLQWGSNGAANGQFSGPHGIDVNRDGNVNVLDLIDVLLAFGTSCP